MTVTDNAAVRTRAPFHTLTVSHVERLCDDARAITFEVPPELEAAFRFRAGQSLTVRRPVDGRDHRRSYSICAPEGARLRIGVREVAGGLVSHWMVHDVRPGDRMEVQPPTGSFTPDRVAPDRGGRHAFIAAGSGITPVLSIIATTLAAPDTCATLFYGNRRTESIMFLEELADLKNAHPARFEVVHVLSREPQEVELLSGRLDAAKLEALIPALCPVDTVGTWWLCGPYAMVTGATSVLAGMGAPAGSVHRELFYVEDQPPALHGHPEVTSVMPGSEVTVVLDGRTTTVTVGWDTPVLDGAQRMRPDLPFACKGGVCGTCRARVTAGEVRMRRNFALEPAEVEAGFVLTCQALPVAEQVTVDYDT